MQFQGPPPDYYINNNYLATQPKRLTLNIINNNNNNSSIRSNTKIASNYQSTTTATSLISQFKSTSSIKSTSTSRQTHSPLRRAVTWLLKSGKSNYALILTISLVLWVKYTISLANYSGANHPPIRGDFEAQRHWIALTSSSIKSTHLYSTPSNLSIPLQEWYSHDTAYWGLDYPPLTAYHSLLIGIIARLSPRSAAFVELRPPTTSTQDAISAWENRMSNMENEGDMKHWLRGSVVAGDLLIWISAVVYYARANFGVGKPEKALQTITVATLSILLQPALILIDNGHFQYNSIMLGLTLWSLNFFQSNHDLLGAAAFVLSLGFKQMALYYSPAVFAYLLGKCLYIGGREGISHLFNIGMVTIATFALVFSPFLFSPVLLLQSLHRIFPFARGLFEDKVANFWCALNIVIKLRDIASVSTLAKLALLTTLLAILPGVVGFLWISNEAGRRRRANEVKWPETVLPEGTGITPTLILLPHALFVSSMAFFLFSFQVHEKSILLPLMPLTLLMGGREAGFARMDWEWAVLMNNVAVFSMWPLLKREGLGLQYLLLTLFWNFLIGYNPFQLRQSFVKYLSLTAYGSIISLHLLELLASPPSHLPDLFPVLNLTLSAGVFGLAFLWASKRSVQEGWVVIGIEITPMKESSRSGDRSRNGDRVRSGDIDSTRGGSLRSRPTKGSIGDRSERESSSSRIRYDSVRRRTSTIGLS